MKILRALLNVGSVIVRDHCHITGKYRGSAHREKFRNNNLKNYGLCPAHYLSAST